MTFVVYLVSLFSICKASEFRFGLQRSTEWQFVGRKVQLSLTMNVPESTPLKAKIKLPFNASTIFRLTEVKYASVSEHITASVNTTTLTSSANDGLNDIALLDLGDVTRAQTNSSTEIKIDFEVQVMNHAHIDNGGVQWVSVGVEYSSQSIWASQLAIRTINPAVRRPDLKVDLLPDIGGFSIQTGRQTDFRLRLSHSALTTEQVVSGIIDWPLPPVLLLNTWRKVGESIDVEVFNNTEMVSIKFGELKFSETVDLEVKFDLDLHKTKADGGVHKLTTFVIVKYNGSADTCSSFAGSREFTYSGPGSAFVQYYVPASCDEPLGMMDGSITNSQITASSHATGGEPYEARLNGTGAWVPWMMLSKEQNQYLEVNFNSKVKIRRLIRKGLGENFVRAISLFYSNDGVIFTHYKQGSEMKDFPVNVNGNYGTVIILPAPLEAVFVRINPTAWENSIALKVEFYGCKLNEPLAPGPLKFTRRGYYLDKTRDIMYVCSVPTKSKEHSPKCFFSNDKGVSWTAMHNGVISLLGHDTVEDVLYGVSLNGKAVLKSTADHVAKFVTVSISDWDTAKAKDTTNLAVMIGEDLVINSTDSFIVPLAEHTMTSTSGTKWGVSAKGFYVEESSGWKLRATWMSYARHLCHFDFEDGGLNGWTKTGIAFDNQPTYGDNPTARSRGQPANQQGNWWIGGAENRPSPSTPAGLLIGDGPQGTLTSASFMVLSESISFLIGGGCNMDHARAELLVNNQVVRQATGKCTETMARQSWDVQEYLGQEARLRLVDASSDGWGHINFDDLRGEIHSEYCKIY